MECFIKLQLVSKVSLDFKLIAICFFKNITTVVRNLLYILWWYRIFESFTSLWRPKTVFCIRRHNSSGKLLRPFDFPARISGIAWTKGPRRQWNQINDKFDSIYRTLYRRSVSVSEIFYSFVNGKFYFISAI